MSNSTENVNCTPCNGRDFITQIWAQGNWKENLRVTSHVHLYQGLQMLNCWRGVFGFYGRFGRRYGLQIGIDVLPSFLRLEHPTEWYSVLLQILLGSSETSEKITCVRKVRNPKADHQRACHAAVSIMYLNCGCRYGESREPHRHAFVRYEN